MRQTLSVVLATFNEEKNLAACLDTLKDIADEIVIVDGTSTDNTINIAKQFGARVKITTNKANFHINKQMAIDMAKKDWILQMDADEHLSIELKNEIKKILEENPKEFNGYWMPRKNLFLGRFLMKGGQYPDYTLRFYRNGKGRLPQKDVHEQAVVEGRVGYLKNALLHYPYKKFSNYLNKWNRYNDLFASQIKEEQKGKNIFQKIFYAFAYLILKPTHWFLTTFIRHKGFMDLWQGFVFSFFSALRFPVSYIKYVGVYKFWAIVILIFSSLLRLWNFPSRWGLGGDDARDAMIGLEALRRHDLPLMGPFSSAGPFVFGGIYYWFIMLSYFVLPFFVNSPWIFMEIMSILLVGLFIYLGKLISGNKLGILLGIFAATSPQLIVRSVALGPHTFIGIFTVLILIFYLLLWKTKKKIYSLLLGLFVGLSVSFHYQGLNLLIFIPIVFLISELKLKDKLIVFCLGFVGFLIPLLPLLYWDSHQSFANIRNLLDYFLVAQYRIYVPNSWRLFVFQYIPGYWSFVVGVLPKIAVFIFGISSVTFLVSSISKKISKQFVVLGFVFFLLLFLNRYYHGERSEGYLLYLMPFILIFTSYAFLQFFEFKNIFIKAITLLFLGLVIILNLSVTIANLNFKSPLSEYKRIANILYQKYPDIKFSVYDYKYELYNFSTGLSLIMGNDGKIDQNGMKIGINCEGKKCAKNLPTIARGVFVVNDLSKEGRLDSKTWVDVSQAGVYDDLMGWLNKNQLKSNFYLKNYIMDRAQK